MDLLKYLFGRAKTTTPVEPKMAVDPAPPRTMATVLTLASTEPEPATVAAPALDPVVSTPIAVEPTVVPPKESPQHLLERLRVRNERHNELDALIIIEGSLPPEKRNRGMAELQKAVVDAIETDVDQREYRKAYYLYQSALQAAKRSW